MPTTFGPLVVGQNRTREFTASIFEQDGITPVILASGDHVRFKVSYGTGLPLLDLIDTSTTSSGSGVTIESNSPASVQITLAQGDTAEMLGVYDAELGVVDAVDSNYFKQVMTGVVVVTATPGGNIGA